ncbi:hypothetical protein HYC85_023385 [Camellia sinensis]|uniref:beta-galactosidase n=1 Tax=Camellia sinensis TaxID=4442 RepID=A0A7J7GIB5_CAMSI|nr:hypothetical protein HYC85_023385 [Camellia sinensis]
MDFIATNSPPILPLNQKCGLRIELDGFFHLAVLCHIDLWKTLLLITMVGLTLAGPLVDLSLPTSYDYDAPIDEYGLLRQPKWGHLKDVHKAIKLCEPAMVGTGPTITSLGPNLEINSVATIPQFTQSGEGNRGNAKVAIEVPITLNYGAFFDKWGAGVTGPMKLKGLNNGSTIDLSSRQWTYQTGVKVEELRLSGGGSSVWVSKPTLPKNQPLIWYKDYENADSFTFYNY